MKGILIAFTLSLIAGLLPSSCATDSNYQAVSYSGSPYYYYHGGYYRRYWYGYRPCPKPPGKPDRPLKPVHPIAKPPGHKPDRPTTLPSTRTPQTRPSVPSTMPSMRPVRPSPAMRGGGGRRGRR